MSRALATCCALLVVLAAAGSASGAGRVGDLSVQVQVFSYTTTQGQPTTTESFSLTCAPPGGTLPFAARICDDISRHPAMLDPIRAGGYTCHGPIPTLPYETVSVTVTVDGKATRRFETDPRRCVGKGPTAVRIYFTAAKGDDVALGDLERGLQCQEDFFPTLNGVRGESFNACVAGLYTPRIDRLIRIAKRAPALAAVGAAQSFPIHAGAQLCDLADGGKASLPEALKGVRGGVPGLCGVSIEHPEGDPTITFELTWVKGPGNGKPGSALGHHTWRVVLEKDRVASVTQTGPPAPQLRR